MMEEPSTPASPKTKEAAELGLGRGELDGITWERRGRETETILVGGVRGGSKATETGERYISSGHP